ncbi:MAG: AAA family ATPase, partial [Micrococcales bacterium]|nr:AAA family ATPase [Micrococcales bacterium]
AELPDDDDAGPASVEELRRVLRHNQDLAAALGRAWPLLEPADLVGDLWTVPAYLHLCAPWLTPDEVRALQRPDAHAWTEPDLPLLDAARRRLGDVQADRRARRRAAMLDAQRQEMDRVVEHLIETDDTEMRLMSMLRGDDLRGALADEDALPDDPLLSADSDALAGPFAHVVVDEAQELTDAQWQLLLARCPSRSFTVVGDRAQARRGFAESWRERLERVGLRDIAVATLNVNYRTPQEVMAAAEPVIRAVLPDADVPVSVRSTGVPVLRGDVAELGPVVRDWLAAHDEGVVGVVVAGDNAGGGLGDGDNAGSGHVAGDDPAQLATRLPDDPRVAVLTPVLTKGLEFDLVVLVDPDHWDAGVAGAVDRYVAMTRSTQELVVLTPDTPQRT